MTEIIQEFKHRVDNHFDGEHVLFTTTNLMSNTALTVVAKHKEYDSVVKHVTCNKEWANEQCEFIEGGCEAFDFYVGENLENTLKYYIEKFFSTDNEESNLVEIFKILTKLLVVVDINLESITINRSE